MTDTPNNEYSKMQQCYMDNQVKVWNPSQSLSAAGDIELSELEIGIGNFADHNNWSDYPKYLFGGLKMEGKVMLDFACGGGRNIVRYWSNFARIDGIDISDKMLVNARKWLDYNKLEGEQPHLFHNNGSDLQAIDDCRYDIVMSTIAMQHIAVHDIRFSLLTEFYRVLKNEGWITIQMAFGDDHPNSVGYFENPYDAKGTNRSLDVRVESPEEILQDLNRIGFKEFDYWIRPAVPGSDARRGGRSIFFRAKK